MLRYTLPPKNNAVCKLAPPIMTPDGRLNGFSIVQPVAGTVGSTFDVVLNAQSVVLKEMTIRSLTVAVA